MTIATWGEAMVRLSPPPGSRLSQTNELALHVGGSEANVAVGLATLGASARWLSVVSDDELGEKVVGELRRYGVDVSRVIRARNRTGLYFYDPGGTGRPPAVTYDRSGSAFATLRSEDFLAGLAGSLLDGADALHLSGIDLALGNQPAVATMALWEAAGVASMERSFDVNFRRTLGTAEQWASACVPYLATCDLLFVAERDARELFGTAPDGGADEGAGAFGTLRRLAPRAEIVVTRGSEGAAALTVDGRLAERPALAVSEAGRIGRGDAFAAGYLWSRTIEPGDLGAALERGIAAASYKSSLVGDLPVLDGRVIEELRRGAVGDAVPGGVSR